MDTSSLGSVRRDHTSGLPREFEVLGGEFGELVPGLCNNVHMFTRRCALADRKQSRDMPAKRKQREPEAKPAKAAKGKAPAKPKAAPARQSKPKRNGIAVFALA